MTAKKHFFPPAIGDADVVFTRFARSWGALAASYFNAFRDLFSPRACPQKKDSFRLFPAMMVYRHAIELLLKAIIVNTSGAYCGKQHSVKKLYETVKSAAEPHQHLAPKHATFVDEALEELEEIDAKGQSFRYPANRNGEPHFPGMPEGVNAAKTWKTCLQLWSRLWELHGPVKLQPPRSG